MTGQIGTDHGDHDGGQERRSRWLTTHQAAERLGVKQETIYAYVSRGLLTRSRQQSGRGSAFDACEVDTLARRSARRSGRRSAAPDTSPTGTVATGITLIDQDRCYYRGVDTTQLATQYSYEAVAGWLWTDELTDDARFRAPDALRDAAVRAVAALPDHSTVNDRLRAAAVAASAADPLRFDPAPDAVHATARGLIATLVEALPLAGPAPERDASLTTRLWSRLSPRPAEPGGLAALNAALILLIDHDLAISTLAARVAASARAHPYAVVLAGLGALDSPLHGAAGAPAHRMLAEVQSGASAAAVVAEWLRAQGSVPGLGHLLYPATDPRATALFTVLDDAPDAGPALAAAREVLSTAGRTSPAHASVDLAVAALTTGYAMPPESGQAIFAVARTAGWIAHALEEYREPAMRLRPSGVYHGPQPPQSAP